MRIASSTFSSGSPIGEALDVGHALDRPVDDGADALDEIDGDSHAEDRGHDVGEEDGRIDAVPPHRLKRHLRTQLRRACQLEEAVALAQRAVLGQRAPGLPHEPHGRAFDRLATRDPHEERLGHAI